MYNYYKIRKTCWDVHVANELIYQTIQITKFYSEYFSYFAFALSCLN